MPKSRRIRDPVHGLIRFDPESDEAVTDHMCWRLLNTAELQRLRRIRQLGVSEYTFPGATHTRFAHSLGVFHVARQLVRNLKRLIPRSEWHTGRAEVAIYAALLHDIGHGPFSHAFERTQESRNVKKRHEAWTAEFILNPKSEIFSLLESRGRGTADEVAGLLKAEVPEDPYHAIVSSSFDADRLDYLRRDRMMTGSGAGAIDFDWLLDNLAIASLSAGSDDDETAEKMVTFCIRQKALQAAEGFIIARYNLFEQVYLHKATRGMEAIIEKLLTYIAELSASGEYARCNLDKFDPLVAFFGESGSTPENYLNLDDAVVWAAANRMASSSDDYGRMLANRLLRRERLFCLDVETTWPRREDESSEEAEARWGSIVSRLDALMQNGEFVIKDVVKNSAYGEVGANQAKAHKRLTILLDDGSVREITAVSEVVRALPSKVMTRYYFSSEPVREMFMRAQP